MRYQLLDKQSDSVLLVARILLVLLFITSGWSKLTGFGGTEAWMESIQAPFPEAATVIAIIMELGVGIALLLGFFTRPLALLLALFTLGTAIIAHHFWNMEGAERAANMTEFFKNLSIIGGLILLSLSGPGRFSIDRR